MNLKNFLLLARKTGCKDMISAISYLEKKQNTLFDKSVAAIEAESIKDEWEDMKRMHNFTDFVTIESVLIVL